MALAVSEIPRSQNPFPREGVVRDADGVPGYSDLPATLPEMLRAHVDARPDVEAVVELGGERLTYAQLWERASRVAGGLRAAGVRHGDRVAVRYPAGTDWALAFWGTVLAGGVAVAVNTRSAEPEVEFVLGDAGVKVDLSALTPLPEGDPYVADELEPSHVAALFYTSGTTGRPKGVPTTHRAFLTNSENLIRCLGIPGDVGPDLRTLISVPLFHVTACNAQFMVAAYLGGTSVIMPALDLPRLTEALPGERISFMVTVPAVYSLLLRHPAFAGADVSGVRWAAYGGAPIAPSLVRALQAAFPQTRLVNGYGMTETASLITVMPHEDAVEHADSVGYAAPSVDIGVVPVGDDPHVGELVVRGVTVTTGYWNRPEATEETIVDGWLHTGDIVRVDDAGRVHIVDRSKDIINRGGENISSVEVEAVLLSAPGVSDAAVLAVPDDVMGEKVGAVLFTDRDRIDVDAVIAHCRDHLADFKIPQYATVVAEALPRNAGGKLLKNRLREQVRWGAPLR
ncbi:MULTISPECIES: class I adenylate-forming enzyme family protein [Streptomyces]|uniref:AMP-binding protein n=1 Tax=Streptomyces solicathayae TaxID=3081768 RepID=A0ABZ0LN03_9ACTN|nr:AMP-binding protein [Streptomyces sp. HUAS YS2]WOX20869.1 AMP-binding protein [Streptomyces sp. HUAS YS2]